MKLEEVARRLGSRVLQPGLPAGMDVDRAIASDRMSDLLESAGGTTLIVTALATPQLLDMAELMEAPAVCITREPDGDGAFLSAAARSRTAVILFPHGLEETRRRLPELFAAEAREQE